ncbi:hypothetical protein [Bacillus salipaludis]
MKVVDKTSKVVDIFAEVVDKCFRTVDKNKKGYPSQSCDRLYGWEYWTGFGGNGMIRTVLHMMIVELNKIW